MADYNRRCLLLNSDFMPMSIIEWTRAISWYVKYQNNKKYGIDIIDFYKNDFINGVNNKRYPIPCVAKTKRFFKRADNRIIFSKKNIFLRDNYTCQYCDKKFDDKELTYDHVIPRSKWDSSLGSPTVWTNIVTACLWCNRKKGNKTPKQANMPLKQLPIEPNKNIRYLPIAHHLRRIRYNIPEEWHVYLPKSYCLQDA